MKLTRLSILAVLFVWTVSLPNAIAQDHTQWHLPEGAKARLGKGTITGNVAYSPDGTLLAVSTSIGVWLYDAVTHQEVNLLTGHESLVLCVAFSPDGQTLASGSWDRTIRLWNPYTGQHKATLMDDGMWDVTSIAFSPDGSTLASGGGRWSNKILLWDIGIGSLKAKFIGHTGNVTSVVFSPDGKMLASGGGWKDNTVRLWDLKAGYQIANFTGDKYWINSVVFSPDGLTLAIASIDDTIQLWDMQTGEHKVTLIGHTGSVNSVAFSQDGQILASGSGDNTVRLWDAVTGDLKATLTGHTHSVSSVAFSPDGSTLVSSGEDEVIQFWDYVTGEPKASLAEHTLAVNAVAFSPDGRTLASANDDNRSICGIHTQGIPKIPSPDTGGGSFRWHFLQMVRHSPVVGDDPTPRFTCGMYTQDTPKHRSRVISMVLRLSCSVRTDTPLRVRVGTTRFDCGTLIRVRIEQYSRIHSMSLLLRSVQMVARLPVAVETPRFTYGM